MPNYEILVQELASRPDWEIFLFISGNQLLRCPECKSLVAVNDKLHHVRWHVHLESQ